MHTLGSIQLIDGWLQDARQAYREGRLTDARSILRTVAWEAESATQALNAEIAQTVASSHDKQ